MTQKCLVVWWRFRQANRYRFIETFNGSLRDECLTSIGSLPWPRFKRSWRPGVMDYNEIRPHMTLKDQTPKDFSRRAGAEVLGKGR